jgi:Legume lectin domain/Chitobiase/beta-hexosaminidase C-terminal domain/Fn3 associated
MRTIAVHAKSAYSLSALVSAFFTRSLLPAIFSCSCACLAQVSVTTQHNDTYRTGENTSETILTPANVNASGFGKLFTQVVDGAIYGQPLYMPNVSIPGSGAHNVVFVTTENDSVYAFDADADGGSEGLPLWTAHLTSPAYGAAAGATAVPSLEIGEDIAPTIGITGTPVIRASSGTLYVVSFTQEGSAFVLRLHALNIATGQEEAHSPVTIQATVPGTGNGSSNGSLVFDPEWENQRPALLLLADVVYVAFGAHGDQGPWHGWIFAYNASSLQQTSVYCDTPNGVGGGFWMSGSGLAGDTDTQSTAPLGRVYAASGNGDFSATSSNQVGADYGDSVLRLSLQNNVLTLGDSFTPSDQAYLDASDGDLGSGGVLVIPDADTPNRHWIVEAGKEGKIYLIDRGNLGSYHGTDHVIQELANGTTSSTWGAGLWGVPAYWHKTIYFPGRNAPLQTFSLNSALATPLQGPVSETTEVMSYPQASPTISANGDSDGIVWLLESTNPSAPGAVLEAYNASNLLSLLYSSQTNASRDGLGTGVKFSIPTVANGKVYAASTITDPSTSALYGQLNVFGLLAGVKYAQAPTFTPGSSSFAPPLSVKITDATPGTTIYYTTDGTTPTPQSAQYSQPITVSSNETITAIASATGYLQSPPSSATYTSTTQVPNPAISPASNVFVNTVPVTITETLSGASVYYTTDGSTPTNKSTRYTGPFNLTIPDTGTVTLNAIAMASGLTASDVVSQQYAITVEGTSVNCGGDTGFTTSGCTMQLNGGADLDDVRLQLTNGAFNQATSAFFTQPVEISSFTTDFSFQLSHPTTTSPFANGFTFTLQGGSPTAVGTSGEGLGFANIGLKSVALKFDFFNSAGEGSDSTGVYVSGATPTIPAVNLTGTGINLNSNANDQFAAHLVYTSGSKTLDVTISDTTLGNVSWSTAFNVDIQTLLEGTTAYAGFTGSTNATGTSSQKILGWTYEAGKSTTPPTAPPTFSESTGTYSGTQTVMLSDSTKNTKIYYTTDGSQPSTASAVYSTAITVSSTETITAIALAPGDLVSSPVSNTYTINP